MKSVYHDVKVDVVAAKAGDNESINGASVDMQGYEGVAFVIAVDGGEAIAGWGIKAQQSSDDGSTDTFADLTGTAISFSSGASADVGRVLDIYQPRERYVRPVITVPNMTAATAFTVTALRYGARVEPVSNTGEFHQSPAEGTA